MQVLPFALPHCPSVVRPVEIAPAALEDVVFDVEVEDEDVDELDDILVEDVAF